MSPEPESVENSGKARHQSAGELALLRRIRARAGRPGSRELALGIGDDCALLRLRPDEELAITTDLSIDGRHFRLDWHPPESIGHRVLARGLSDLAAMGARPVAAFLSLGLPAELVKGARVRGADANSASTRLDGSQPIRASRPSRAPNRAPNRTWVDGFLDGFLKLAQAYKVSLAGGDLAESPVAVADIVLAGAVARGEALLRSGARPGNVLYVTGKLGGAAAALCRLEELDGAHWQRQMSQAFLKIPGKLEGPLAAHLYPQPRVAQGLALVRRGLATAAIDLSDGLSTDLHHLCEESGVAAEVDARALPLAAGAAQAQALHGGEDYELLFAATPGARVPRELAGVPVTRIGRVLRRHRNRPEITLLDAGGERPLAPSGWEHFS
jgi:thiamine-monophosphate kinase